MAFPTELCSFLWPQDGGIGYAQFIIENTGKIADHYQMV
jgi:hypothetical protein